MGNVLRLKCFDCANAEQRQRRNVTILLVGMDNAGKTSIVKSLAKEKQKNVLPTVGFSSSKFHYRDNAITIYDLGGHKQIRDIWEQYFVDVHGVMFVVDSTDRRRLDECKDVFRNLLGHANIAGKPVLLLANKQDKPGALDELDVVDRLNVESVVNANKCPTLVETCTALHAAPINCFGYAFVDPSIASGFDWLVLHIVKLYDTLNRRVTEDMTLYKANVNKKMEEWKKKQQTSNDSYLLSFNAPHRRSTRRNPFRHINKVIDSFESKTSSNMAAAATEMGSTSYIVPLRSESDDGEYEPPPALQPYAGPVSFRNRVAPLPQACQRDAPLRSEREAPGPAIKSRSPLFRAKSRGGHDDGRPETANGWTEEAVVHGGPTAAAEAKRSVFRNKSISAGGMGGSNRRPPTPDDRVKSLDKNVLPQNSTNKEERQQQSDTSCLDDEEDVVAQKPDTSVVSSETISNM